MLKNKKFILVAGIIVVIAILVFYGIKTGWWKKLGVSVPNVNSVPAAGSSTSVFPTRQEAPKGITIPEPNSKPQNSDIAVPQSSGPAAPGVTERQIRTFNISAQNGQYVPSEIIVGEGDSVVINFKAEDGTYDIVFSPDYYNLKQTAKKGETKIVAFQAIINGQFKFYCQSACPKGKMEGTLIVVPR